MTKVVRTEPGRWHGRGSITLSAFASTCLVLGAILALLPKTNGALTDPGFWDASQDELDKLVIESMPYFRLPSVLGNGARYCNRLPGYEEEQAYKLTNATVLVLDEDLLCTDFPETCSLARIEKDEWIIEQAGWFSSPHIASGVDKIPHDPSQSVTARRACAGGRVLLLPNQLKNDTGPEWIDVKGLGSKTPKAHTYDDDDGHTTEHSNGLFAIFEALYEYLNDKTIAAVLNHHSQQHPGVKEQRFHTVGIYGVISLGFEFPWGDPSNPTYYAAGGLLRQASRRSPNPHGWMAPKEAEVLEQILNSYGMRSDGPQNDANFQGHPNQHCRRFNLQGTMKSRTLTDLGTFQGERAPWPPGKEECLVNWGQTERIVDTHLWRSDDGIGSARVHEFLREDELRVLPRSKNSTYPARLTSNARLRRMWEAEDCWWNGRCGLAHVKEAVSKGRIDHLLLTNENATAAECEAY